MRPLLLLIALLAAPLAQAQVMAFFHEGTFDDASPALDNGLVVDVQRIDVAAGQRIAASVASLYFAPYVALQSPSGEQLFPHDADTNPGRAFVQTVAREGGAWHVIVTTQDGAGGPRPEGAFTLDVALDDPAASADFERRVAGDLARVLQAARDGFDAIQTDPPAVADACAARVETTEGGTTRYVAQVRPADMQHPGLTGQAWQRALRAALHTWPEKPTGQDVAMFLECYDGELMSIFEGLQVAFEPVQRGGGIEYDLVVMRGSDAVCRPLPGGAGSPVGGTHTEAGRLDDGDVVTAGRYMDRYAVVVYAGQTLTVEVVSPAFTPFVTLLGPSGRAVPRDAYDTHPGRTRAEVPDAEAGAWRIIVSSEDARATGPYTLTYETRYETR